MSGAVLPLPQYAFMARCSVKAQGQLYFYLLPLPSNNKCEREGDTPRLTKVISSFALKLYF